MESPQSVESPPVEPATTQPLVSLPATPVAQRPAPLKVPNAVNVPSPPITPVRRVTHWDLTREAIANLEEETTPRQPFPRPRAPTQSDPPAYSTIITWDSTTPALYSGYYILRNECGRGAWSTVYRAEECGLPPGPSSSMEPGAFTPPNSPLRRGPTSKPEVFAVKVPLNRGAHAVLAHEARVLTYLHSYPKAESHIVPFHGFNPTANSVVMGLIPLTLNAFIEDCVSQDRAFSTRLTSDPVIGADDWIHITVMLIRGLSYLHSRNCVHGDIKPANILLEPIPRSSNPYVKTFQPYFCDFSSSVVFSPIVSASSSTTSDLPAWQSAITTTYAAPELLTSSAASTTFQSDIYSLGVTLLVAALGESPYASARNDMQRLAWAKEGSPLVFGSAGEEGVRVREGGTVRKWLKKSLERLPGIPNPDPADDTRHRWYSAAQWEDFIERETQPVVLWR
jgi:serine/threonine protein kinase